MPPWRGVSRPIAALGCRRPDDEWRQGFPFSGNALNGGDQLAFDRGSSVSTPINRVQHIFARGQIGQQVSCFIHVVHVFCQDGRIMQHPVHECKPVCHLFINIVPRPIKWLQCSWLQIWVAFIELLDPILSWGTDRVIVRKNFEGRRPSTGDRPRQLSYWHDEYRMIAFGRTQDVVYKGLLFGWSEVLPFGCGIFPWQSAMFVVRKGGYWHFRQLGSLSIRLGLWKTSRSYKDGLCRLHGLSYSGCLRGGRGSPNRRAPFHAILRTLNLEMVDKVALQRITRLCCRPCIWRYQEAQGSTLWHEGKRRECIKDVRMLFRQTEDHWQGAEESLDHAFWGYLSLFGGDRATKRHARELVHATSTTGKDPPTVWAHVIAG